MSFDPHTILLIEDNEDDVFIFRRAFKQAQLDHTVHVSADGQDAIDYLLGAGRYADRSAFPLPFLVLLDLKLPLRHGLEVLECVRTTPGIAALSVTVLTSSAEPRDIARARELGAGAYLVKPPRPATLASIVAAANRAPLETGAPTPGRIPGDLFNDANAAAGGGRSWRTARAPF